MKSLPRATASVLVLFWAGVTIGAEPEDVVGAIAQRVEAYVQAYNDRDAAALAELWSDDAVYLNRDTGEAVEGRTAIADMFADLFAAADPSLLTVTIQSIRLVTPEVAIEDGVAELANPAGESEKTTYTAVHVKKDGQWYLHSVRETDAPLPPEREPREIDQLAWLVGDWLDQDEASTVRTQCEWTKGEKFLTCNFAVTVDDRLELEGTQVIGWDAGAGVIRSWIFDSEGGIASGTWRRAGNQWYVDVTSTQPDGSQGSAVNVYTLISDDEFLWRSVDRQIDGEVQPDVDEVTVYRQQ